MCKIANIFNVRPNAYHKLMGLWLKTSGTSKKQLTNSQLQDSVAYSTLTVILAKYGSESQRLMSQWAGEDVLQCGDNLDIRSRVRFEGAGSGYHDIHLYNNMVYKSRVSVAELNNKFQ